MRIAFIQDNPGSRTARLIHALTKAGHECGLFTRSSLWCYKDDPIETHYWRDPVDYMRVLPRAMDYDIWHVGQYLHSSWLTPIASLVRAGHAKGRLMPRIVHDARDIKSLIPLRIVTDAGEVRTTETVGLEEISAFRAADAVVHVSKGCDIAARAIHGAEHPKSTVVHCCVSAEEIPELPPQREDSIVYSGGMSAPGDKTFRDYCALFGEIATRFPIYAHPANATDSEYFWNEVVPLYELGGVKMHETRVPDLELTAHLARHKFVFVGFPYDFTLGHCAMPNKLFEGLAAGCVPVVHKANEARRWVEARGYGFGWETLDELERKLGENQSERQERIWADREQFTQEHHLGRLVGFYRRALKNKVRKPKGHWMSSFLTLYDYGTNEDYQVLRFAK